MLRQSCVLRRLHAYYGEALETLNLNNALAVGLEQMQRNFKPTADQIAYWRQAQITDGYARLMIYKAFVESKLNVPKHLARVLHN